MRNAIVLPLLLLATSTSAQEADPKSKPITTTGGKVGELLRQWWNEGTAAGNVGDWYDNRDGAHSDLNTTPYPQLQRVVYSADDIKARRHWAAARITRPEVTFGNSSTSAPANGGGSNPRQYYVNPQGIAFLHHQYRNNNLYIYPEHRDHDPGHNGHNDGYGDLYPTNTPYLLISQGSSGSDQPFMRALPLTLAAFRPEVKAKLIEKGLLMPTVQMILRRTNKHLKGSKEYFTGKAHPTVFEGAWVDELGMVEFAHAITVDKIPPLVQLKVIEETPVEAGKDFFDPARGEHLADTPGVIARIFRGHARDRRYVVSAGESFDVNGHPLTFTWSVLRGDPDKIKITPRNKEKSVVEIVVSYHARGPVSSGSPLESNRIDIGVFADNGFYSSAPAFLTLHSLDWESRVYDEKGRPVEIGYGLGETTYHVKDWPRWLDTALGDAADLLKWSDAETTRLRKAQMEIVDREKVRVAAAARLKLTQDELKRIGDDLKKAEADKSPTAKLLEAKKQAEAESQSAQKEVQAAVKQINDVLDRVENGLSIRNLAMSRLRAASLRPDLMDVLKSKIESLGAEKSKVETVKAKYQNFGYSAKSPASPMRDALLERANAIALERVYFADSLTTNFQLNFVDQRLSLPRFWRDLYRYTKEGEMLGWTRHDGTTVRDYSVHGLLVLERDELGRCKVGRRVNYIGQVTKLGILAPLRPLFTDSVVHLRYDNDHDVIGHEDRVETRPVEAEKKSP